jgi:hypothetical protein
MAGIDETGSADDPYNLSRFVRAQEDDYEQALAEIRDGRKCSHWMWFIFPQFDGLGFRVMPARALARWKMRCTGRLRYRDGGCSERAIASGGAAPSNGAAP